MLLILCQKIINSDSPEGWERWLLIRRNIKEQNKEGSSNSQITTVVLVPHPVNNEIV